MGEATRDLVWVIGIFIVLGFVWLLSGGPSRANNEQPFLRSPFDSAFSNEVVTGSTNAPVTNASANNQTQSGPKIRLQSGSAFWAGSPNQEYITIEADANNSAPVNISGWTLTNNPTPSYRFQRVAIPLASRLLTGQANQVATEPVILRPGDRAIIVTGRMPAQTPYRVSSFLVNKCSGYLGELPDYQFSPGLWSNCPAPSSDSLAKVYDKDCYQYLRGIGYCHTPVVTTDQDSNVFLDGRRGLSGACINFAKTNFSYTHCVNEHFADADFYGKEWRVYLNQSAEIWDDRDKVSLYNQNGVLVSQIDQNSY